MAARRSAVLSLIAIAIVSPAVYAACPVPDFAASVIPTTAGFNNLDPARSAIGVPAVKYTDPTLMIGTTTVKAAHIQELRSGVK